jgi:hypothetical protein
MDTTLRVESLLSKIAKWYQQSSLGQEHQQWPSNVVEYLEEQFGLHPEDRVSLQCVTISGSFGGFTVSIVRIFSCIEAAKSGVIIRSYHDLDEHPRLIAFEGYAFENGPVHLYKKKSPVATSTG